MQPARDLLYGSALYHIALWTPPPRGLALRQLPGWPGDRARGDAWLRDGPPQDEDIHRFQWLADLAAVGGERATKAAREWTLEWVRRFGIYDRPAWDADMIGDRLFAWIAHFDLLRVAEGPIADRRALLASLARQARHLALVAGSEAGGLARLAALRGLIVAAAALGSARSLAHGLRLLARETEQQILADGGHRARGPAAQLAALRALVDARAALLAVHAPVPEWLGNAIDRAGAMLRFFRHGDGKLALFNGAAEGDAAAIDLVLDRAAVKSRTPLTAPDTGFERLQAAGTVVLFDCGKPAPETYAGDAHAGTLSFEMSHGRDRIIVNCGAHHGAGAQWRAAMRASAAHSTLIVADTNSTEVRPDGSLGPALPTVTSQRAEQDGNLWVAATHDGYQQNFGLVHGRQLFLSANGEDLRGEDALTGTAGRSFAIRFHLHPAVVAALAPDSNTVQLRLPGGGAWRLRAEGAVLSLGESIYRGEGAPLKTRQVLLDGHVGSHGATVRWAIRREVSG